MDRRNKIMMYAAYAAYISSHALSEVGGFPEEMVKPTKESGDLTASKCRWLIREFNNNSDGNLIPSKWKKMFSSLNNRITIRVNEFSSIDWDENVVLAYYEELAESRRLISELGDAIFEFKMDMRSIAEHFGKTKNQLWGIIGHDIWIPTGLLDAIRASLPVDEGFPGRFQISIGEVNN